MKTSVWLHALLQSQTQHLLMLLKRMLIYQLARQMMERLILQLQVGNSPYTYLWNDGNTDEDRTGLGKEMYSVEITDSHGCTDAIAVIINCPEEPGDCSGFRTQTQGGWGADPHGQNNGVYVHQNFDGAFPSGVSIGCTGATLSLTSAQAVTDFLPSGSSPATLPAGTWWIRRKLF
jgi:hypothetical protein